MPATPLIRYAKPGEILTGHFRSNVRYRTNRDGGTGDWLLIYTVKGRGRFGYSGGEIKAAAGDAILLRPGTRHDYGTDAGAKLWEIIWTHFEPRPGWLDWLRWPEVGAGLGRIELSSPGSRRAVEGAMREMNRLANSPRRHAYDFAMNALELALLRLDRFNPASESARIDPRIVRTIEATSQKLSHRWSVRSLAEVAKMSESRFAHVFKEQIGSTPQQFVERQRLARAAQLLQSTSLSIKEIAHEVGFASPFYFTLRFKAERGFSPRDFRRRSILG